MKIRYFTTSLLFFTISVTLQAKTVFLKERVEERNPTIATRLFGPYKQHYDELKERVNYIWPVFVSSLSLATKDEFFTVVKKTESPDQPGHFIIGPVFAVTDAGLSNNQELKTYFSQVISDPEIVENALSGLKQIEIEGAKSNHYIVPIKTFEALQKFINQAEPNDIVLFEIPETEADFILTQEKLSHQNTIMDDSLIELAKELSAYTDFMNFARVEEVKDYIRKFEKKYNPWAGEFYSITD